MDQLHQNFIQAHTEARLYDQYVIFLISQSEKAYYFCLQLYQANRFLKAGNLISLRTREHRPVRKKKPQTQKKPPKTPTETKKTNKKTQPQQNPNPKHFKISIREKESITQTALTKKKKARNNNQTSQNKKLQQQTPSPNNLVFEIQFILEYQLTAMEKNANQQKLNLLQALHLFRTHLLKQCLPKVIRITISCIRYLEARQNIPNTPNCHIYLFNPQCGPFTKYETEHGNKGRQDKNHGNRKNGHRTLPSQLKEYVN